jgi:hypothetical protein
MLASVGIGLPGFGLNGAAALETQAAHRVQFRPTPEQQTAARQQQQIQPKKEDE